MITLNCLACNGELNIINKNRHKLLVECTVCAYSNNTAVNERKQPEVLYKRIRKNENS